MTQYDAGFWAAVDRLVAKSEIIIDRPRGSAHPKYPGFIYPVNYGYLKEISSTDCSGIDIWRGRGMGRVDAIIVTVDLLKRDSEIKILIGCSEAEKRLILASLNDSPSIKAIIIQRPENT